VDALRTEGDFRWFDDAATRYNPVDDAVRPRVNNDAAQLAAHAVITARTGAIEWVVVDSLLAREEGVPGPAGARTTTVRFATARNLLSVEARGAGGRGAGRVRAWLSTREERLDDPLGEIGVSAERTRDRSGAAGLRAVAVATPSAHARLAAVADWRVDGFFAHDRLSGTSAPARLRQVVRLSTSANLRFAADRLAVDPVIEWVGLGPVSGAAAPGAVALAPRVATRWRVSRVLSLGSGVSRDLRPPDLLELYGDRGALVGRPDLRPERGWQADAWLRVALPEERASAELVAFVGGRRDGIVYVQNAQRTAIPMNLDRAAVRGLEGTFAARVGRVDLRASATHLLAVNRSEHAAYAGKDLPRQPRWQADLAATARLGERASVGWTTSHASGTWLDATNWFLAPPRTLHGAFARVRPGGPVEGLSIELGVANLLDARVQEVPRNPLDPGDPGTVPQAITDFAGYPLPGRTALAALRWTR
jgi:iron complex outermembrane receptor protein